MDYVKSVLDFDQKATSWEPFLALPNILSTLLLFLRSAGLQKIYASALFAAILSSSLLLLLKCRSSSNARHYAVLTSVNLLISGILIL